MINYLISYRTLIQVCYNKFEVNVMHNLACPKCKNKLIKDHHSYKCCNNHTYDIAKTKYVNLLLNPDKATNYPGDSKDSLIARKAFLDQGYYDVISDTINQYILTHSSLPLQILDLGCGQGYYTNRMKQQLNNDENIYYGLDISKEAINMATKYTKDIHWIVGNSKNVPILDSSMDIICALFTVVNVNELKRCLKKDGYIIHVTANQNHLIEIKELIYEEIKLKSNEHILLPFNVRESFNLVKNVTIKNHDDLLNLLKMTPHYYHIKKERRNVLDNISSMDITIDIQITIYEI